jgi:hypothetical protein
VVLVDVVVCGSVRGGAAAVLRGGEVGRGTVDVTGASTEVGTAELGDWSGSNRTK